MITKLLIPILLFSTLSACRPGPPVAAESGSPGAAADQSEALCKEQGGIPASRECRSAWMQAVFFAVPVSLNIGGCQSKSAASKTRFKPDGSCEKELCLSECQVFPGTFHAPNLNLISCTASATLNTGRVVGFNIAVTGGPGGLQYEETRESPDHSSKIRVRLGDPEVLAKAAALGSVELCREPEAGL